MTTLQIRLLGNFSITYRDATLPAFTSPRLQSFLAYLLLCCRTPQPRQQLAFHLWPDSTEAQAHSNLRKAIHQLRHALPECDNFLHIDTRRVQWRPQVACTVDVDEFFAKLHAADPEVTTDPASQQALLAEAIALYRGDLLPGCYDEWVIPERERLRQVFVETLERLVWVSEDRRDYTTALHHANHLLRAEPLAESAYQQLMRLHALTGDRAAALQVYHTCVTVLQRELGVEPGAAIQAAHTQLLAAVIPAGLRPAPPSTPAGAIRLVGRQAEWQRLRTLWQQSANGQTNFCLLHGEAGIGKTRLAEEVRDWVARQGVITATTRSYAAEGALAYAPVVEWLRAPPLQTALATLAEPWLTEVARLLPELLVERPTLPRPAPLTDQWQRQRLFEALARAFTNDGQPKLLLIDDLQWCDGETLAWLRYLRRFTRNHNGHPHRPAPLLLLGTVRSEEIDADHPLTTLLLDLRRHDEIIELTLTPLNATETAELAAQLTSTPLTAEAAQSLYRQSEGNPLFVVEMVRTGMENEQTGDASASTSHPSLPPKVQAVIQQRLNQLSPAARQLLGLAATIGRSFSFALLQQASSHPEEELVQQIDELWQRGLVREQGIHTYDFSHDRIRDAAYALVSPVQRPLWHKRVAQALEALYADDLDPVSAQLATHYEQAGLIKQAIGYYQRAAKVALRLFSPATALTLVDAGLALAYAQPHTQEQTKQIFALLLARVSCLIDLKGYTGAEIGKVYHQLEALLPQIDDDRLQFSAHHWLRQYHSASGNMARAQVHAERLIAVSERLQEPESSVIAQQGYAIVCYLLGDFQLACAHLVTAEVLYQTLLATSRQGQLSSRSVPNILSNLAPPLWRLGYPEQAYRKATEGVEWANKIGNPGEIGIALFFAIDIYISLTAVDLAAAAVERILALDAQYNLPMARITGQIVQGWIGVQQGNFTVGIAQMRAVIDLLNANNHTLHQVHRLVWLIEAQMQAADWAAVGATLNEAFAMADRAGQRSADAELHRLRGEWLLQAPGASPQATAQNAAEPAFQQALAIARTQAAKSLELRAAMSLCRLWQQQGKQAEAYALLAELYRWFTEGFATADLQKAKALLAELA